MEANLNKNMKKATIKERIKAKAEANEKAREQAAASFCNTNIDNNFNTTTITDAEIIKTFCTGELVEKTPRGAKPPIKKKKKGKK